jgi:hypothetical protein
VLLTWRIGVCGDMEMGRPWGEGFRTCTFVCVIVIGDGVGESGVNGPGGSEMVEEEICACCQRALVFLSLSLSVYSLSL